MAGLMAAAMVLIEISVMRSMYENRRFNAFIVAISIIALAAFFMFIRQQTAISDRQFLKSMIPHHAGAILMCEQAAIEDAEIKELCKAIVSSQQAEIDQMKRKLDALKSHAEHAYLRRPKYPQGVLYIRSAWWYASSDGACSRQGCRPSPAGNPGQQRPVPQLVHRASLHGKSHARAGEEVLPPYARFHGTAAATEQLHASADADG
jgi:hypothetical protein